MKGPSDRRALCGCGAVLPWLRYRCSSSPLQALDDGAGDDVVAPGVVPPDPRLVAAVVIGAEQDQRPLLLPHAAAVGPLWIQAAPHAHEGVLLPLVADR